MSRVFTGALNPSEVYLFTASNAVYNSLPAISIASWVKFTGINSPITGLGAIVIKDPAVTIAPGLFIEADGTILAFADAENADSITNESLSVGVWTHVAMTWNSATDGLVRVYINGTEATYSNQDASMMVADDSALGFYFGNDTVDDGFIGSLAETAIWNVALSGAQISALAASTTGASAIAAANLVGYWHLCGNTLPEPDASGKGNTAAAGPVDPAQGADSPGFNCSAPSLPYSVPDCRVPPFGPNMSRTVQDTKIYDVQTSSNSAIPGVDSNPALPPTDSRVVPNIPENSRAPGTYGPGE